MIIYHKMAASRIKALQAGLEERYPGEEILVIQTHISIIFLVDAYAFKVKKAVNFGFINSLTLEKRKFFCEKEVLLNNRLTEGVYLGVISICKRADNTFAWDCKAGEIVEYAVKMNRLDTGKQMDVLLEKGMVFPAQMEQLAQQLAVFHSFTDTVRIDNPARELSFAFADLINQRDVMIDFFGADAGLTMEAAVEEAENFLQSNKYRLEERQEQGFVIDGHGDLHSGNIFLLEEPVIFDCIDFNDAFRRLDVLNELAFLCMDLNFYGRTDLERHFLTTYLRHYPVIVEDADWHLFRFFKWYRANVRLKVNLLGLRDKVPTDSEYQIIKDKVEEYWLLFKVYRHLLFS